MLVKNRKEKLMNEYNMMRFFNQFIATIKKDIKSIGIITDKDGTLLLNSELRESLEKLKNKNLGVNIHLIANSGRTVSDMINCLENENIPLDYFDYIIGDNGGMCLDVKNNKQLFKHVMDKESVEKVINQFIQYGGIYSNIRLADGKNIYAYTSDEVKEYYKDSEGIVFKENITDIDNMDITKLTLTGTHSQIYELNRYIEENIKGHKTHIGVTSFPIKSDNNYRLDFTGMHTKGSAAKYIKKKLDLDMCIYLGNDLNDISMFSQAIDNDDFIVIASHEEEKITKLLIQYLQEECFMKGINWENIKLLLLKDRDVNRFLLKTSRILNRINNRNVGQNTNIRRKYRVSIAKSNRDAIRRKKVMDKRVKNNLPFHR